jgi:DNA polymerase-3 subunit beta
MNTANTLHARVDVERLRAALVLVCQAVDDKKKDPAIITGAGNTLTVRCRNGHVAVSQTVPAEVTSPGTVALDAHTLLSVTGALPGPSMELSTAPDGMGRVHVTCGRFKAALEQNLHERLPDLDRAGAIHDTQAAPLATALGAVAYAQSTDETRWILNGIRLAPIDGVVHASATDGHRLAHAAIPGLPAVGPLVIDRAAVPALLHVLREAGESAIRLGVEKQRLWVSTGEVTCWAGLLEGTYPDVGQVLPKQAATTIKIPPAAMRTLATRVGLVQGNTASLQVEGGELTVRAHGEVGDASDVAPVEAEDGAAAPRMGVSIRYLRDALAQVGDMDEAEVWFGADALDPLCVRGGHHVAVVMPVRLDRVAS